MAIKWALVLSGGGGRGAFQVGVWQYLQKINWQPDLICGTSVGALNAVALGCGMTLAELTQLWQSIESSQIYRLSIWQQLKALFKRGYVPLLDNRPLERLLKQNLNVHKLRESDTEIQISAVNVLTSEVHFFDQNEIDVEHVMASSAIPVVFPWQQIGEQLFWDGGVMVNTPILTPLEREADEIIVVLLSPIGGHDQSIPANRKDAIERLFEQGLIGSYQTLIKHFNYHNDFSLSKTIRKLLGSNDFYVGNSRIITIAPDRLLGLNSILQFSSKQSQKLIDQGFAAASEKLGKTKKAQQS